MFGSHLLFLFPSVFGTVCWLMFREKMNWETLKQLQWCCKLSFVFELKNEPAGFQMRSSIILF